MKSKYVLPLGAALCSLFTAVNPLHAQGNAFTYQGRFTDNGVPYTGNAELQATLWDAVSGGGQIAANSPAQVIVGVTNGLFVLPLDFGASFPGANRWLQLEVRTAIGPFTALTPRQPLTPAPYAITAGNLSGSLPAAQLSGPVASANLAGTYSSALTLNNGANSFTGNGGGLTNLNASQLASGTLPDARLDANVARTNQVWLLGGNAGTTPGTHFLGTTDNVPLELKVNNQRVLRIGYATDGSYGDSPNSVGGFFGNVISNGFVGAVIGGGGYSAGPHRAGNHFATVVGGRGNTASGFASTAMNNFTTASGDASTAMGNSTTASGFASIATGDFTIASGNSSTAMGFHTRALHDGSFVWADRPLGGGGGYFASTADNQFLIRASGGVGINTTTPGSASLTVNGYAAITGANALELGYGVAGKEGSAGKIGYQTFTADALDIVGAGTTGLNRKIKFWAEAGATFSGSVSAVTFNPTSDRNAKENFVSVDSRAVLEKVAALPISQWNFKQDTATRHLGPMAQDFYAAFGVGPDDKHIATVDADGVALAAIQGLNQKLAEQEVRLENKDSEIQELRQAIAELKKAVRRIASQTQEGL